MDMSAFTDAMNQDCYLNQIYDTCVLMGEYGRFMFNFAAHCFKMSYFYKMNTFQTLLGGKFLRKI